MTLKKIRYEVIGWTHYDSEYQNAIKTYQDNYNAVKEAVIENIRQNCLSFDWQYHWCGLAGAPVLNTGEICRFGAREWSEIMGEAWLLDASLYFLRRTEERPLELRKRYPKAYVAKDKILQQGSYALDLESQSNANTESLKERIAKLLKPYKEKAEAEEQKKDFYREIRARNEEKREKLKREIEETKNRPLSIKMTLSDDDFSKIKNGTKVIEVRLNNKKCRRLIKGCFIRFVRYKHKEDQQTVRVVAVTRFNTFKEFYQSDMLPLANLDDLTLDDFLARMHKQVSKEDESSLGVVAITIEPIRDR